MPVVLSTSQRKAVDTFQTFMHDPTSPYMIISGFAGSGKSFLVKFLTELAYAEMDLQKVIDPAYAGYRLYFTATTNKAAEVLKNMLGEPVRTIHSLLGLRVSNNYKTGKQQLKRGDKRVRTPDSIIFIDESSMINMELLGYIQNHQSKNRNCKLVYIGDPYQLPPVMEDVSPIFSRKNNHVFLNEIQRQVAGSPIIQLSSKYRDVLDDPEKDWPVIPDDGKQIRFYENEHDFKEAIEKVMSVPHDPQQYKVLAWSNSRVRAYNKWIRKLHGLTDQFELGEIMMTNKPLMWGKEIIATTDSLHRITGIDADEILDIPGYQLTMEPANGTAGRYAVFQPADWVQANKLMRQFASDKNWHAYFSIKENWADMRSIHSLTCHKAQGSTYEEVFVDLSDIGRNTRWKEAARLAYVAVTRASHKLHVHGNITTNYTTKHSNQMGAFQNVLQHIN